MVHIKRVELSHFKSFGGTTQVPLLPGFTVVSGPNGSGKSNILDALLFALGLASSKGMRAERLPDLVNHKYVGQRGTSEVSVSVTFDLEGMEADGFVSNLPENRHEEEEFAATNSNGKSQEWTVTRRLRVTQGGSYSSTYYMDGEPCTATELHVHLNRLRIYPEGYNVVLQGDVTRIITMNSRERREIIDELAGVAEFDRKISQVRRTLDEVREREDRCHIIEEELARSRDRLAADRTKAEKYQKLKEKIHQKQQWEAVLIWRSLQQQEKQLQGKRSEGEAKEVRFKQQIESLATQIQHNTAELTQLNIRVKALGEDEQLSLTSQLATQKVKRTQIQQQQQELKEATQRANLGIEQTQKEIREYEENLEEFTREKGVLEGETLLQLSQARDRARTLLQEYREQATQVASASEAWVQEQTALSKQINTLQQTLNPQRTEQAQLNERDRQLSQKIEESTHLLQGIEAELNRQQTRLSEFDPETAQTHIQDLAQRLAALEAERALEEDTQTRLLQEQRDKQRQLDKLEATQQAQQEAQGTYATKIILQADLPGICGLVAQLAQVDPRYQLALETSAGARLGYVVVEDDRVAATGIELLKQRRAGRATFLPLNKIRAPRIADMAVLRYARGFIDYAANLIDCQQRYRPIFAYVFGGTAVFETLDLARPHLGKTRIVTLDGEILESSGAMTGGSKSTRSTLHFGTVAASESREVEMLSSRLAEIALIIDRCAQNMARHAQTIGELSQELTEARQQQREEALRLEQVRGEIERLTQQKEQIAAQRKQNRAEITTVRQRLQDFATELPRLEAQLQEQQQRLTELEASQTHSEWQVLQQQIQNQEREVQQREVTLREGESRLQSLESQCVRLREKIGEAQERVEGYRGQVLQAGEQEKELRIQWEEIEAQIGETQALLNQLSEKLGETKKARDRAETALESLKHQHQQQSWELEKLQEIQKERATTLATLQEQIAAKYAELPNPLPEIPNPSDETNLDYSERLERLQKELHSAQKRLEAMEPVNMLALEEYERTQTRLQELTEKLTTLADERTELLLRIENFTTLRLRAFKEAFDAVNENFQITFASLSQGDGYLELENAEDPFAGGLNLIAHPKGKPVQRLSSMSGGEKSLTALSFIFSLQRYRPSPFYAFDEVDMFLDGANVERLSKMIAQQAQQAQFIVVSLRRPMIESAERTIGVTQARGAHTQVLGIKL
ncbi:chromosome segregation protein SMC [Lusitaniella coriacea]|uniref:chromosome segregation protein SMC n=1 Tax=Lusitaniella coriacea TaxID=1983105 RepID=UPI003CF2B093